MHAVPQQLRPSMEVAAKHDVLVPLEFSLLSNEAQRKYKMYLHVYQSL
jgi:hypothetical protein